MAPFSIVIPAKAGMTNEETCDADALPSAWAVECGRHAA
jgi:hypothetical protein